MTHSFITKLVVLSLHLGSTDMSFDKKVQTSFCCVALYDFYVALYCANQSLQAAIAAYAPTLTY
jgi:hypothetical protein